MSYCIASVTSGIAILVSALFLGDTPLAAQATAGSAPDGALAITADEVYHHIGVIAHDSMEGRDTPSAGLEKTAQYVADQLQALGLKPAGDPKQALSVMHGSPVAPDMPWLQRYQVPGTLRAMPSSTIILTARLSDADKYVLNDWGNSVDRTTPVDFETAARFAVDTIPESGGLGMPTYLGLRRRMSVFTGRHTPESIHRAGMDHAVVLYVPPAGLDSASKRRIIRAITATSNVVVLADEDSASFAARRAQAFEHPPVVIDKVRERSVPSHWAAYVWPGAVGDFLRAARLDLVRLRADTTPQVRTVPSVGVMIQILTKRVDDASGVNAAAMLAGADSLLRNQLIVISAHMDNAGITPGRPARIHNGANDNASGVAGLLALAKAFSRPGARPRRSLLFVATSGGALGEGRWGADAIAETTIDNVGLNLTLDMIGRVPGDSLRVNGLGDFDFATRPDWLALQHPELGLQLVDGGTALTAAADHLAFLQRAVPSLYFHAADHDDHAATLAPDTPEGVDADQEVRVLRLLYYVIQDLANGERLPRWTAVSREQRTRVFGQ